MAKKKDDWDRRSLIEEQAALIYSQQEKLQRLEEAYRKKCSEYNEVIGSKAWRITAPLRFAGNVVKWALRLQAPGYSPWSAVKRRSESRRRSTQATLFSKAELKKQAAYDFGKHVKISIAIAGNQLAISGHNTGWELVPVRMLHLLPFFGFGLYYKRVLESAMNRIPAPAVFAAVLLAKTAIVLSLGRMPDYTSSWCSDFTDGPVMPVVTGILGIVFYMKAADLLKPAAAHSKAVRLIADNTYSIMMNHLAGIFLLKTLFAAISRYTPLFHDFDLASYREDIWWYYMPGGISHTLILYVIAGMVFPLMVQKALDGIGRRVRFRSPKDAVQIKT